MKMMAHHLRNDHDSEGSEVRMEEHHLQVRLTLGHLDGQWKIVH